jgi:uncharacterized protein YjbI with pentapeptide repeats
MTHSSSAPLNMVIEEANNSGTSPERLYEIYSNYTEPEISSALVSNPNTPPDVLLKLGKDFPRELLANPVFDLMLLENRNLLADMPGETLISLLRLPEIEKSYVTFALNHCRKPNILAAIISSQTQLWNDWRQDNLDVEIYLKRANLSGADLSGADLKRANLKRADLMNANLSGADLSGADLKRANLRGADLTDTNLSDTDLAGADLWGADLSGADLTGADLTGANLEKANLSGADLAGANLTNADLMNANLSDTDLTDTNLSGADLTDTNLSGANLTDTNLSGANLTNADLAGADLTDTNLSDTDLVGADLTGANLSGANLRGADLTDTNLSGANLAGADLTDADLDGVDLEGADLTDTDLTDTNLWGANLTDTDLSGANLTDTDLTNADLAGANLRGANLNHTTGIDAKWLLVWDILNNPISNRNLKDADLEGANLESANLKEAELEEANLGGANLIMIKGAKFDSTGNYRYLLWRCWDKSLPALGLIMLNPSTADANKDDPTIKKCIEIAQQHNYGSLWVGNLFAYPTPKPEILKSVAQPVGPQNDRFLLSLCRKVDCIICAWGNDGTLQKRDQTVTNLLKSHNYQLYCFGKNKGGQPKHPNPRKPVDFEIQPY